MRCATGSRAARSSGSCEPRAQEAIDAPLVEGMVDDLTDVHVRVLQLALDVDAPCCSLG